MAVAAAGFCFFAGVDCFLRAGVEAGETFGAVFAPAGLVVYEHYVACGADFFAGAAACALCGVCGKAVGEGFALFSPFFMNASQRPGEEFRGGGVAVMNDGVYDVVGFFVSGGEGFFNCCSRRNVPHFDIGRYHADIPGGVEALAFGAEKCREVVEAAAEAGHTAGNDGKDVAGARQVEAAQIVLHEHRHTEVMERKYKTDGLRIGAEVFGGQFVRDRVQFGIFYRGGDFFRNGKRVSGGG